MKLKNFILLRKKVYDYKKTSYGFKCLYFIEDEASKNLLRKFDSSDFREIYEKKNKNTADLQNLKIGDEIVILVDLSKFPNYFESFTNFINYNRYSLKFEQFYIFDLNYYHGNSDENSKIDSFLLIQDVISFLRELSVHEKEVNGYIELLFHKPDKICPIKVDYFLPEIDSFKTDFSIQELYDHVFEKSDEEARRKLYVNEMINLLSADGLISFSSLLKNWNRIHNSYKNSFQLYLSEFSFEKIKSSSLEYFHEQTNKIYSTITKFSTHILVIPVAYILILRFLDFNGESFQKDTILIFLGILYFVIIWFVLLSNVNKAFEAIEEDISNFIERLETSEYLGEIVDNLNNQKNKVIPNQKNKIKLVKIIGLIILVLTLAAYFIIYSDVYASRILNLILESYS